MVAASAPGQPADNEYAWSQWWEVQYKMGCEMDLRIDQVSEGRSDQFKAALVASMIEHLGEQLRRYLHLPDSDDRPEGEPGG